MEDRETARMCKYGESKTTRIMMAPLPHVTSGLGLRKFQADGFFVDTSVHLYTCSDPVQLYKQHISILKYYLDQNRKSMQIF